MKKILFYCLIIISFCQTLIGEEFVFTPLNINFNGIEAKDNIIAAYGDFGSMFISYDDAATWSQKRVFEKGSIVKMFFDDDKMTAFNDIGEISISGDEGKTWQITADLEDSILTVIRYPGGYFLRSRVKLLTLTDDFKPKSEIHLISKPFGTWQLIKYKSSTAYFKGHFIVQADTSIHIRFDTNFTPIDTFSLEDFGSCTNCWNRYELYTDSNYLYTTDTRVVDNTVKGVNIYRTKDFITFEKYYEGSSNYFTYKVIENELYYIERHRPYGSQQLRIELHKIVMQDSSQFIAEFQFNKIDYSTKFTSGIRYTDFTIANGKYIIAGKNKFLAVVDISEGTTDLISMFSGNSLSSLPDRINDSTYLFTAGDLRGNYDYYIHLTHNNGLTFETTISYDSIAWRFQFHTLRRKYYDKEANLLYFLGGSGIATSPHVFISNDYGETFDSKLLPDLFAVQSFPYPVYYNISSLPNLYKNGDNFITANYVYYKQVYSKILTYDKNFNLVSNYLDSNFIVDYISSTNTNSYLIHCMNALDFTFEIKYTTDRGVNWEIIKKYSDSINLSYYKEIEIDNREKLAIFNFNDYNNIFTIDILDIEDKSIIQIYEQMLSDPFEDGNFRSHSISCDSGVVYIAAMDTIFYSEDIFDRESWKHYVMPNNGKIIRPFNRYGKRFYARYSDDIYPDNIYWIISKSDLPVSITQAKAEVKSYLYTTPPYPLPAANEVRSFIYWDPSYNMEADNIVVYDIYGAKVSGVGDIAIDKHTSYSGYLIWNCSGAVSGIYIIRIKHGTNSRTIMAIVNK